VASTQVRETFVVGEKLQVRYEASAPPPKSNGPKDDLELVVFAPPVRRKLVAAQVDAALATRVPGTSGDVLRVVESMPGVARPPAGSGALVVWGAAPADTRVAIDGVPVPRLWHQGGVRSVLHPSMVQGVEVVPGAPGAAWGRGIGGLVRVDSSRLEGDDVKAGAAADLFDASGFVQAPLSKNVRAQTAARVGWLSQWADWAVGPALAKFAAVPRYGDAQLRLRRDLTGDSFVEVVALGSIDDSRRGVADADPHYAVLEQRRQAFGRLWLRWRQGSPDGEGSEVLPWLGWQSSDWSRQVGAASTQLDGRTWTGGVRASHRARAGRGLWLAGGVEVELARHQLHRLGSASDPPREGDPVVLGQPIADQLAVDAWRVLQVGAAPWAELGWQPSPACIT
jgi:hypothetical protein